MATIESQMTQMAEEKKTTGLQLSWHSTEASSRNTRKWKSHCLKVGLTGWITISFEKLVSF